MVATGDFNHDKEAYEEQVLTRELKGSEASDTSKLPIGNGSKQGRSDDRVRDASQGSVGETVTGCLRGTKYFNLVGDMLAILERIE